MLSWIVLGWAGLGWVTLGYIVLAWSMLHRVEPTVHDVLGCVLLCCVVVLHWVV